VGLSATRRTRRISTRSPAASHTPTADGATGIRSND
jgi:hypothetical protein